jgi:uncharacterized protein YraI
MSLSIHLSGRKGGFSPARLLLLVALLLALSFTMVSAQDTPVLTDVYVTTQDFSSLRAGPGTGFPRLAIVTPVVTMPAYGRTSDTRWVQVEYEGQMGWIASFLLVWSGDIIDLPVDGVNPYPFIRRAAALGTTTRETPIYSSQVTPEDQVGTIPAGTEVELTGRLGGSGFFRFQIRYQGQLYWVGSWNIRVTDGDFRRLLDLAYLYPYGRLVIQLENNLALAVGSYAQILGVWQRLNQGSSVACEPLPPYVRRILTDADVHKEVSFQPAVTALDSAIQSINSAISAFADACADPTFTLTPTYIHGQLTELDNARRSLILTGSLLEPLRRRNPLLDTSEG